MIFIKQVTLKFIGGGYNNIYQANVAIHDKYGCLLFDGVTYNGDLIVCLEEGAYYIVKANLMGMNINQAFVVNQNDKYIFLFPNSILDTNIVNDNIIAFQLTDYYYPELPIKKGEMILWQKI